MYYDKYMNSILWHCSCIVEHFALLLKKSEIIRKKIRLYASNIFKSF